MHVYFIHARGTDRYKIGITARSMEYRMKELNGSQSAYPLELVTFIRNPNYKAVEQQLHERYKLNRVHGEWFVFTPTEVLGVQNYLKSFDTPLNAFKPILKPKSLKPGLSVSFSDILIKQWVIPLLLGISLILICRQCQFFQPSNQIQPQYIRVIK